MGTRPIPTNPHDRTKRAGRLLAKFHRGGGGRVETGDVRTRSLELGDLGPSRVRWTPDNQTRTLEKVVLVAPPKAGAQRWPSDPP